MTMILFTCAAQDDLAMAYQWYERQDPSLGANLLLQIDEILSRVCDSPLQFPCALKDVRRAKIRRFPYSIFFKLHEGKTIVIAVFHHSRAPISWQTRISPN